MQQAVLALAPKSESILSDICPSARGPEIAVHSFDGFLTSSGMCAAIISQAAQPPTVALTERGQEERHVRT